MTAPLGTGFPDFARQASEAQVLEINDINVNLAHNFQYNPRYVGNAKALQLWANPPANGMRVQFQFYGDQAHTVIMDSYVVQMKAGDVAKQPIPILGPWLFVVVQHGNAAANTVTIQLWRTPELGRFAGLEGDTMVFSQDGIGIGAGATVFLDSQYVMEGPAEWTAFCTGPNWAANVSAEDYLGTKTTLIRADNTQAPYTSHTLHIPPWHIAGRLDNASAAVQTYYFFLSRRHNV